MTPPRIGRLGAIGALVVAAVACSAKPRAEDVGGRGEPVATGARAAAGSANPVPSAGGAVPGDAAGPGDAAPGDTGAATSGAGAGATGDLQVRVEWVNLPAAARSSPGRTRCNTPRAPSVAPTTTWGIPDALVVVEGAALPSRIARVVLADCALAPRIAVGDRLAITSAVDRPARLVLRKRGSLDQFASGPPVSVMLPIAGHTATAGLDTGAIYSLETDDAEPELAFVAALPGSFVTDATGHVTLRDLAVGAHAITAWLPPRGGQPARLGRGTATITAGDLAELTVRLSP